MTSRHRTKNNLICVNHRTKCSTKIKRSENLKLYKNWVLFQNIEMAIPYSETLDI